MSTTMPNNHNHIVHRNREQPAPDPDDAPIDQIQFYLDRYRIKEALHVFYDEETFRCLREETDFMWDIIPLICKRLRGLNQFRFRVFEGCEKMLCRIAIGDNCNPKEVLISLLSEINPSNDDDNIFRAMIRPLEGALFRMKYPHPRSENLRWTLSVLLSHINNIEWPQEYSLEGKERLLISNDLSVKRFIEVVPLLLGFVEDFIEQHQCKELSNILCHRALQAEVQQVNPISNSETVEQVSNQERRECKFGLLKTVLSLINHPLVYLDIFTSSEIQSIATRCLDILVQLRPNIYSLIYSKKDQEDWIERLKDNEELGNLSTDDILMSLANTSYIHHCINLVNNKSSNHIKFVPPLYTPEHTLIRHMPLIVTLLDKVESLVYEKGLALLEALLKSIPKESLNSSFVDILDDSLIDQQLFKIIVFCPFSSMRKFAFTLFTKLCDCLNQECRYRLLKTIVKQANMSAGIRGACIDLYRKYFIEARQEYIKELVPINNMEQPKISDSNGSDANAINDTRDNVYIYSPLRRKSRLEQRYLALANSNLSNFLKVCAEACLPDAHQTDILENYEMILAILNFLRFLKLSDSFPIPSTVGPRDDFLNKGNIKTFLNPLRSAISLNMSDLKIQQKDIDEKCSSARELSDAKRPDFNVSLLPPKINGPNMHDAIYQNITSNYTKEQESDCIKVALCRLDLIQSVFVLISDLFDS